MKASAAKARMMALDGATRELYEEICRSPKYTRLIHALDEAVPTASGCPLPAIALVPGILYRDYPQTGADGAAVRALAGAAGAEFHTIPTDGTAGLDAGAAQVVDWLVNRQGSRPCILVSLSKGSAEVRVALEHPRAREAFASVRAWVSVSGLPLGTPSFEHILSDPIRGTWLRGLCCWKSWSLAQLRDLLRHRPDARLRAPEHLAVVHVVAFPQHAHLADRRSRRLHRALAASGPNDGFALLEEIARLPGYVYPIWGADHYLRTVADVPARLGRLLDALARGSLQV